MSERAAEDYRGHQLVAVYRAGKYVGVAWKGGTRAAECEGKAIQEVLRDLRAKIDGNFEVAARTRNGTPKAEEYISAFRSIQKFLTDGHLAMIKAHCQAPDYRITATKLAEAAGYENYKAANLQYGSVGKQLFEELPMELPLDDEGKPIYTFMLATGGRADSEEEWVWEIRPEVVGAIKQLGLTS